MLAIRDIEFDILHILLDTRCIECPNLCIVYPISNRICWIGNYISIILPFLVIENRFPVGAKSGLISDDVLLAGTRHLRHLPSWLQTNMAACACTNNAKRQVANVVNSIINRAINIIDITFTNTV